VLGGNLGLELEVYHFQLDIGEQVVQRTFPGFTGPASVGSKDVHVAVVGLNALYRFGSRRIRSSRGAARSLTPVGRGT
jgi:hypothetical protein